MHSKAKNASMAEYKKATGLEALMGYLYLSGQEKRLSELIELLLEQHGNICWLHFAVRPKENRRRISFIRV